MWLAADFWIRWDPGDIFGEGMGGSTTDRHRETMKKVSRMSVSPPPQAELYSVIAVAQTQVLNEVAVTVLSLELYNDSLVALIRIVRKTSRGELSHFPFIAFDDLGNTYRPWNDRTSREGSKDLSLPRISRDEWQRRYSDFKSSVLRWRAEFVPSLSSAANLLRIELPEIYGTVVDLSSPTGGRFRPQRYECDPLTGPWTFSIPIRD